MEAQCNFCASCLTEDSGGSWWTTGQGKSVWCQMCWERESANKKRLQEEERRKNENMLKMWE